jgi:predicted metal-dependent hydrolase
MLSLPGGPAWVEWRRSPRARRISLRIDPRGGAVVVTLPRLAALPVVTLFADGAAIPLHGVEHRIRHAPGRGGAVWVEDREILVAGGAEFLARRVSDFLRAEARRRLGELVAQKALAAGVAPRRITVKDTKSRWGSCAASRNLAFSWRLVMAPRHVQDYVAAHEVAHLRHMNHGARFWALVAELTPHTDAAVVWLRTEGPRLLRVG